MKYEGGDTPIYGINKMINPRNDAKFSPNLYRFITFSKRHYTNVFQDPNTGFYYIGLRVDEGWWCGAKLFGVFCFGGRSETFSYGTSVSVKWHDVTNWFWTRYMEVGKRIYDLPEWKEIHPCEHRNK
jgi:hypothetical protein